MAKNRDAEIAVLQAQVISLQANVEALVTTLIERNRDTLGQKDAESFFYSVFEKHMEFLQKRLFALEDDDPALAAELQGILNHLRDHQV